MERPHGHCQPGSALHLVWHPTRTCVALDLRKKATWEAVLAGQLTSDRFEALRVMAVVLTIVTSGQASLYLRVEGGLVERTQCRVWWRHVVNFCRRRKRPDRVLGPPGPGFEVYA